MSLDSYANEVAQEILDDLVNLTEGGFRSRTVPLLYSNERVAKHIEQDVWQFDPVRMTDLLMTQLALVDGVHFEFEGLHNDALQINMRRF